MHIAFQLTELFQIEIDAVIYTVLKKVKEFYNKKRLSKGWSGVHLLHDNASSQKCEVVKSFLASEKVKVLNHSPYSPDLTPCDFFLFPRLEKMLSGNKYTSRSSLDSAVGLGGSVGCAVRLETRRSRVQPPPRSATFFRGD